MGKLGEDWLFIGLGIGAVYLVYKLTKPVSDTVSTVSNALNPPLQNVGDILTVTTGAVENGLRGLFETLPKYLADLLNKKAQSNNVNNGPTAADTILKTIEINKQLAPYNIQVPNNGLDYVLGKTKLWAPSQSPATFGPVVSQGFAGSVLNVNGLQAGQPLSTITKSNKSNILIKPQQRVASDSKAVQNYVDARKAQGTDNATIINQTLRLRARGALA